MARYIFPRWTNKLPAATFFLGLGPAATAVIGGLWYYGTNKHLEVGYQPKQPVPYSHRLHVGELGMDCRYCHTGVEKSSMANLPPTETCMNCHAKVRTESVKLLPIRESYATDQPVPWVRVHNLPDYVFFNHAAHLKKGVGCESCHGRIDKMDVVEQQAPLSMDWCVNCHRDPTGHLRDPKDITKMGLTPLFWNETLSHPNADNVTNPATGQQVNPPTHCYGCHR